MKQENDRPDDLGLDMEAPRSRRRWLWIILLLLLAGGAAAWFWLGGNGKERAITYQTTPVRLGRLVVKVTATGTLSPLNSVEVSSELSGIVKSVEVDYNHRVTKGQVLARLDPSKLEAKVRQSEASLAAARAKLLEYKAGEREARSNLARLRQLHKLSKGKMPSQNDLEAAEASLEKAQANVASGRASIAQAEAELLVNRTDLSKTSIRSPVNGIVLSRAVEPGQTVASSLSAPVLFTLAEDLSKMELVVNVDEADVGLVKEGQKATFTVDAFPNKNFEALITQVRFGPKTVNNVVTYETVLSVDNRNLSLRPGMTATADIVVREIENALLVPNAALRFQPPRQPKASGNGGFLRKIMMRPPRRQEEKKATIKTDKTSKPVWVLKEGQPKRIRVTTGLSDGVNTQVVKGRLADGDAVIVAVASKPK